MALQFLNDGYFAGTVGIGTNSPTNLLSLRKDVAGGDVAIYLQNYNSVVGSTDETVSIKFAHGNDGGSGYVGAKIVGGKEGDFESSPANVKGFMSFYTNEGSLTSQVEQMRINGDGNVGIGTITPLNSLDIYRATGDASIRIQAETAAASTILKFRNQNADADITVDYTTSNQARMVFTTDNSGGYVPVLSLEANRDTLMYGSVGIGTTSPDQQLEILYPSYINKDTVEGLLRLTGQSNTENAGDIPSAGVGIEFYNKWTGGLPYSIGRISARASQSYDGGLQFDVAQNSAPGQSNFTTAMTILDSGKVGIGTTTPSEKLDVAGNIKIQAALLSNQENTDVDTGTETVANVAIATYTAAFFDFVVKKGTNVRSGTVYACHDGTNVEFTETSTNDLGDTSDVTLSVDISGTNMRLLATVTSDDWSVKSLIRAI